MTEKVKHFKGGDFWIPMKEKDLKRMQEGLFLGPDKFFVWKKKYHDVKRMELRREESLRTRDRAIRKYWNRFFDEGRKYGKIWGYVPEYGNPKGRDKTIFTFEGNGFSTDCPKTIRDRIAMATPEELPLLINEEMDENTRTYFKKVLSGEEIGIPFKQDIVDIHNTFNHRRSKFRTVLSVANNAIRDYVERKYAHLRKKSESHQCMIKMVINGREYIYTLNSHKFELIHTPESYLVEETI